MNDERHWRLFAGATMLTFFFALLVFAARFDAFLTRFLPVFLGLLCVALIIYALVAAIVRTVMRVRRASHPDESDRPR